MGHTEYKGLACHSVTCSITALVTRDINVGEISASYISLNVSTISLVVMPLAYKYNILSSIEVNRVWFFLTNSGSKLPSLSRGVSSSTCPSSVRMDFEE